MGITKYCHHMGNLEELTNRHDAFGKFRNIAGNFAWHPWTDSSSHEVTLDTMVLFIGKTGYGKSSTVNAITGMKILETSNVAACTRVCQCINYHIHADRWLSLGDMPGIGEDQQRDIEYFDLYERFLGKASAIVHVIRADARDYAVDQEAIRRLFRTDLQRRRVIYALGQCDKIEPLQRASQGSPSNQQLHNIEKKIAEVKRVFSPRNQVIPYSAESGWNLSALTNEVVRVALGE